MRSRGEPCRVSNFVQLQSKRSKETSECFERNQAVIYRGPFREVLDDDNHRMERGKRYAVCDKTYNLYKKAPYSKCFEFVEPIVDVLLPKQSRSIVRAPLYGIRRKPKARLTM